ncbi:MAG: RNA polymerase sigma factor [Acidimicrobiia bacterium]
MPAEHIDLEPDVEGALNRLAREEGGRVLALLASRLRDLDLADDAVQDALAEAVATWPVQGVPANPPAWLMTVARRKAIDRLRRAQAAKRREQRAAIEMATAVEPDVSDNDLLLDEPYDRVGDERLRLMFLCCHPALDQDTQIALTLRLVAGLTTAEIAAAYVIPEATLAQRIVRAKRKIRGARIPLAIPTDLTSRVDAILGILYLVFNEGYLSRGDRPDVVRVDLLDEAIRLTGVLAGLVPEQNSELLGLAALQHFHRARVAGRLDTLGELVLLEDQDRQRWNHDEIRLANALLAAAMRQLDPGPYQLQAIIASHHANAPTAAETDWRMIVSLYRQLVAMTDSPIVRLNHAVAVAMADSAQAGLDKLDQIGDLDGYHLLHATRAELLRRSGRSHQAIEHFATAIGLTTNPRERRLLERSLAGCRTDTEEA